MTGRTLTRRTALLTLAALAACGQAPPAPRRVTTDSAAQWAAGLDRIAAAEDADVAGTVAGLWAFADRFAGILDRRQNTVFSPASLGYGFGMLRAASDGETARQLDKLFRFPPSLHQAFAAMRRDIVTTDGPPSGDSKRAEVAVANGFFLRNGLRVDAEFDEIMRKTYGAQAQHVDFRSDEAIKIMDAWVREQTADRIDKLFDELPPDTIAVLANAVYLKAFWTHQFDAGTTKNEPFRLADGGRIDVPMMRIPKAQMLNYASGDGLQAVELPYDGGELAMWLLVPTDGLRPPRLDAATLTALGAAKKRETDVMMPRWDFGQNIDLLPELAKLGLTALGDLPAFGGDAFVGAAIHRANITVDESGTEAAAVTGIAVLESAPQIEETVRADRPFTFAVVHKPTAAPLFVGTVNDPTKS